MPRVATAIRLGACIITDRWAGIEQFLEPGKEVLVASTGEEVAGILDGLRPERAAEIGRNAFRRVMSEHTYTHRAREVDSTLIGLCR